jgi:shikimate dehydrogenase
MDGEPALIRLALFGSPVGRSLSPRIHAEFAAQAHLEVEYTAVESTAERLEQDLHRLARSGGRGCNITVPLKHRAFELASRTTERARRARAVNTLMLTGGPGWKGDNTDGVGLIRDVSDNLELRLSGQRICVLGAGGAAAGILYELLRQAPASITIYNRTVDRAAHLAELHAGLGRVSHAQGHDPSSTRPFDLVINATSAGQRQRLPGVSAAMFGPGAACYDLNYGRAHRALRDWCGDHGVPCHDGLGMLVEQAAESFRIWTGHAPQTRPVLERLRQEPGDG